MCRGSPRDCRQATPCGCPGGERLGANVSISIFPPPRAATRGAFGIPRTAPTETTNYPSFAKPSQSHRPDLVNSNQELFFAAVLAAGAQSQSHRTDLVNSNFKGAQRFTDFIKSQSHRTGSGQFQRSMNRIAFALVFALPQSHRTDLVNSNADRRHLELRHDRRFQSQSHRTDLVNSNAPCGVCRGLRPRVAIPPC